MRLTYSHLRLLQHRINELALRRMILLQMMLCIASFLLLFLHISRTMSGEKHLRGQETTEDSLQALHSLSDWHDDNHALLPCLTVPVLPLSSIMVKMYNDGMRSRFQEGVWDTVIGNSVFSVTSDMPWRLQQYSEVLPSDISILSTLAFMAALRTLKNESKGGTGEDSDNGINNVVHVMRRQLGVNMEYLHIRVDRAHGLQFAGHFHLATLRNASAARVGVNGVASDAEDMAVMVHLQRSLDGGNICRVATVVERIRPFRDGGGRVRSNVEVPLSRTVSILMPYKNRPHRLNGFIMNFARVRESVLPHYNITLTIGILRRNTDDMHAVQVACKHLSTHSDVNIRRHAAAIQISFNEGDVHGHFSRAVALREAAVRNASTTSNISDVLLQMDVDVRFAPHFIPRCAQNAIEGRQVYFPIMYTLYSHAQQVAVTERNGFWRTSSYGLLCIRRRDFDATAAFADAERRFHGWGEEDVEQYERIRTASGVQLVPWRAVDPGVVHLWHFKACEYPDVVGKEATSCMQTNFMTMGHPQFLGPILLQKFGSIYALSHALRTVPGNVTM